jgi:hypothetical protein
MEEKKSSLMKNALNWGVIMGIVLIIYSLLMFFLDLSLEKWVSWVSYIFIIGVLVLGTINYRDKALGGVMTYGQALGFGVMTILFASIINAIYFYVFVVFIDPEFINKMLAQTEEMYVKQGLSEQQIETAMGMVKKFMNPILMCLISIPSTVFMGLIISLITSAIFKKNQPEIKFNEES